MQGFYRIAVVSPELKVADIGYNVQRITQLAADCHSRDCALTVFPELCVTGYTCADLFLQSQLLTDAEAALATIATRTRDHSSALLVGAPLRAGNNLFNCAVLIQGGEIVGAVPKSFIPNYKEFYEKRWFQSGRQASIKSIMVGGKLIPFGTDLLFQFDEFLTLGIEICEDLWCTVPPSSYQALAGATVIANLSASNELVAKSDYRRDLVCNQAARCMAAYAYTSSGVGESSTDLVFSGHTLISENGALLAEGERFISDDVITTADVDCERLRMTRITEGSMPDEPAPEFRTITCPPVPSVKSLDRWIDPHPFVPSNHDKRSERCHEIFNIQASGLAKRLKHIHAATAVIGISGGLDSTLALLVCHHAMKLLGRPAKDIITVTMPGFGTTGRTYTNAVNLCTALGTTMMEIDIKDACNDHFKSIDHDPETHDVTYENVQARERTKILMNLANKHGGIVIGTGDLSEMALGWSTYNGDHMSMYAVNCSVPKTLVRYVIEWVSEHNDALKPTLDDVLDTPISPELLPKSDDDTIVQQTEKVVGPYELHDFFLYHIIKYGATPTRVLELACIAFKESYDRETIHSWLTVFIKRFFQQQFKRSCIPDGPKVGTISLSPRGDWRMPSDASANDWLEAFNNS